MIWYAWAYISWQTLEGRIPIFDNSMAFPIDPLTVMQLNIDFHGLATDDFNRRAKRFEENPSAKAEYPAILGSNYGKQPCPLRTLRSFPFLPFSVYPCAE